MAHSSLRVVAAFVAMVAAIGMAPGVRIGGIASSAAAADLPPAQKAVTLTINPDGTAVWDGVPLPIAPTLKDNPALKDKLERRTQQSPLLELDLRFHSVSQLNDSNRQTLMDIVQLAAQFGYVHIEPTADGAKLMVLGPGAAEAAPK